MMRDEPKNYYICSEIMYSVSIGTAMKIIKYIYLS